MGRRWSAPQTAGTEAAKLAQAQRPPHAHCSPATRRCSPVRSQTSPNCSNTCGAETVTGCKRSTKGCKADEDEREALPPAPPPQAKRSQRPKRSASDCASRSHALPPYRYCYYKEKMESKFLALLNQGECCRLWPANDSRCKQTASKTTAACMACKRPRIATKGLTSGLHCINKDVEERLIPAQNRNGRRAAADLRCTSRLQLGWPNAPPGSCGSGLVRCAVMLHTDNCCPSKAADLSRGLGGGRCGCRALRRGHLLVAVYQYDVARAAPARGHGSTGKGWGGPAKKARGAPNEVQAKRRKAVTGRAGQLGAGPT